MPRGETEPLLPRHEPHVTSPQFRQKPKVYQMMRAFSDGYMPSNDQAIAGLRALLATDALNEHTRDVTGSGRQLIHDTRRWIRILIDLLRQKNSNDQFQDFLWRISHHAQVSWSSLNAPGPTVGKDVKICMYTYEKQRKCMQANDPHLAAYDSLRIITNLLLTNAAFRLFAEDIITVGRQIFADTSFAVSEVSRQAGKEAEPSTQEWDATQSQDVDKDNAPSKEDLGQEAAKVADTSSNGLKHTGQAVAGSIKENLTGQRRKAIFARLKEAVITLRQRPDYFDSITALGELAKRYLKSYSIAIQGPSVDQEDPEVHEELKQIAQSLWTLLKIFGDSTEWEILETRFNGLLKYAGDDDKFNKLLSDVGSALLELLTNPDFFDSAPEKVDELTQKSKESASEESRLLRDADAFLAQAKRTLQALSEDRIVTQLANASKKLYEDVSDSLGNRHSYLLADIANIIIPRLLRSVQYVPITRLGIVSREIDLLVENLVFEPAHRFSMSSFVPDRTLITTRNDIDIVRKHSKRVETDITTTTTVTVLGLNASASEFGYWANVHAGPIFFKDEGLASFHLDRRGIDITLDVEITRDRIEQTFRLVSISSIFSKDKKISYF